MAPEEPEVIILDDAGIILTLCNVWKSASFLPSVMSGNRHTSAKQFLFLSVMDFHTFFRWKRIYYKRVLKWRIVKAEGKENAMLIGIEEAETNKQDTMIFKEKLNLHKTNICKIKY